MPEMIDYLGQPLEVGQICFYMNSAKGQLGNKCEILAFENGKIRIRRERSSADSKGTLVEYPGRFIVLTEILKKYAESML